MAKPNTRQTFIDYCLRSLGAMKVDELGEAVPAYQNVNRETLIPYLVSAIQELTARVRELENS